MIQIPCFRYFTKTSILKFSYFLKKQKFIVNQVLYKEGDPATHVFIIKSGEFQMTRTLPQDLRPYTDKFL